MLDINTHKDMKNAITFALKENERQRVSLAEDIKVLHNREEFLVKQWRELNSILISLENLENKGS